MYMSVPLLRGASSKVLQIRVRRWCARCYYKDTIGGVVLCVYGERLAAPTGIRDIRILKYEF